MDLLILTSTSWIFSIDLVRNHNLQVINQKTIWTIYRCALLSLVVLCQMMFSVLSVASKMWKYKYLIYSIPNLKAENRSIWSLNGVVTQLENKLATRCLLHLRNFSMIHTSIRGCNLIMMEHKCSKMYSDIRTKSLLMSWISGTETIHSWWISSIRTWLNLMSLLSKF